MGSGIPASCGKAKDLQSSPNAGNWSVSADVKPIGACLKQVQETAMLTHSFLHLTGVGRTTEESWWDEGITTWDELDGSRKPMRGNCRV